MRRPAPPRARRTSFVAAFTVMGAVLGDRVLAMRVRVNGVIMATPGLEDRKETRRRGRWRAAARACAGAPNEALPETPGEAWERAPYKTRKWKEALIAKRFVSCDVTPMGDRVADGRAPSMGVGRPRRSAS